MTESQPSPEPAEPLLNMKGASDASDEDLSALFDEALKLGLLVKSGNWYTYDKWKAMGKPNFVKELKYDKILLDTLRSDTRKK